MKKFTNVEKKLCPCCNSDQTKYLGMRGGKYQREGLGIESKIVQCINCSVIYPNPFPIPESLESLYGDTNEYFSKKRKMFPPDNERKEGDKMKDCYAHNYFGEK